MSHNDVPTSRSNFVLSWFVATLGFQQVINPQCSGDDPSAFISWLVCPRRLTTSVSMH